MNTGHIAEGRAVDGAIIAIAMLMMTASVRRTRGAVRKGMGKRI